jgi:hypothetical protein
MVTSTGSGEPLSSFSTAKPGNHLYCHEEFLQKLEENRNNPVGKRASLLLHRLLVDVRRQQYKTTQGANRGWRRTPLGGSGGSHFYAWWAPAGAAPLEHAEGFDAAPRDAIFLRDIRHHDDHSPCLPQSLTRSYLPVGARDLRAEDYVPAPWTNPQVRFATARQNVRIIKGHPGSGKTTALWHAADLACHSSGLYVTYSTELAALARDYFDKYIPAHKQIRVVTFSQLLREILGLEGAGETVRESRARFLKAIGSFSNTIAGPWLNQRGALYDEMHAHMVGDALPFRAGTFPEAAEQRLPPRNYRARREQQIGRAGAEAAIAVADALRNREAGDPVARFFPELALAWQAVQEIRGNPAAVAQRQLLDFDCMAVDEVQDLTPIEALVLVKLAAVAMEHQHTPVRFLAAGDEAQTLRPTDFEWGWFQDLLYGLIGSPVDFRLTTNLRSPRRIAELVNCAGFLYGTLEKGDRPSATVRAEVEDIAGDQVLFCAAAAGGELTSLLETIAEREGTAIVALGDELPAYIPESLRSRVLTSFEAKGLDFRSVCVLEGGKWISRVLNRRERGRGVELDDLTRRLAIDQLRVAISRPTERLIWLDVAPTETEIAASSTLLSAHQREFPVVPALVLKTLEEDSLPVEERVRLCESDALQLLAVKPALAWSRARQAVKLLDSLSGEASADRQTRVSAHLTLAQVAFTLVYRRVSLPAEMGRPDLYAEAMEHAVTAGRQDLARIVGRVRDYDRDYSSEKLVSMVGMLEMLVRESEKLDSWLVFELKPRAAEWIRQAEDEAAKYNPVVITRLLPGLYRIFEVPDGEARLTKIRDRAIRSWIAAQRWSDALALLAQAPGADPALSAQCHEGLQDYALAAERFLAAGKTADALRNYRSIPDFDKTMELIGTLEHHPAKASLEWVQRMRELAAQRPPEFAKALLPTEKKMLEEILETSLGATRKKAAPRKTAAPRKRAPIKAPMKKAKA